MGSWFLTNAKDYPYIYMKLQVIKHVKVYKIIKMIRITIKYLELKIWQISKNI